MSPLDDYPEVHFLAYVRVCHTVEITPADYVALWAETGDPAYLRIATVLAEYAAECRAAVNAIAA